MECKDIEYVFEGGRGGLVLIETLWNVKLRRAVWLLIRQSVLIETLWNVKRELDVELNSDIGINRNIVECKDVCRRLYP